MDDIRAMFLRQSMLDCEENFYEAVARRDAPAWDWLVVTAANAGQAAAYEAQIQLRLDAGLLPRQTRYKVIADPGGKRVGSGGATLNVIREIAGLEGREDPFSGRRILVLHSGGDSQRIPQYSACGKLFSRVPRTLRDGRASTLFDEFCISLSCVPSRMNGGMLVMSGDVLLLFNALQIDLERTGAACLSIKAPVETGTHHGVFLSGVEGGVKAFLHKQDENTLRENGAVNSQGMVDIDTGAIWLDETRVEALHNLVREEAAFDRFVNEQVRLSFYGDFVYPMAGGATLESYLAQSAESQPSEALTGCRHAIWKVLSGTKLSMIRLAPAEFIHFGTTAEWRALLLEGETRFDFLGWRRSVASVGASGGYTAINSIIAPGAQVGDGSAIEDSRIGPNAVIGAGCVLSGVDFDGVLPDNTVLHMLPLADHQGWCRRTYGVADNPKESKRFGKAIDEPLWTASLHPVWTSMQGGETERRMSLKESFAAASLPGILAWQTKLKDDVRAELLERTVSAGNPVEIQGDDHLLSLLEARTRDASFPLQHRLYYALSRATEDAGRKEAYENACWKSINDHMLLFARQEIRALPVPRIVTEATEVKLPLRVNWGGGWSDTPPYCLENGGTVLNASLLFGGRRPVCAQAQRLSRPVIRVESDDLGVTREYTRLEELQPGNPHDPHALCKAALAVCGVVPDGGEGPIAPLLTRMGGGILLRTAVENVPKGSGLGTSSILCAAVVRVLSQLLGQPDGDERMSTLTLCMEQLMSTGGGWQDQVGGLMPGIKLVSSRPGTPQRLSHRHIAMTDEAFAELSRRHVLVFTGQRRMARSLLRDIMGKVVASEPEAMAVLSEIQRLAVLMAFALETGDIDQFSRLLREHWALSKRLDAGSSNTCIDHLVAVADDLIDGLMICGAGGGGFMSMILKKNVIKDALVKRLADVYQESGVAVWDAELER